MVSRMDCDNANGAEYLQMAISKVVCNRAEDKVPGLWKTEWINRRMGDFGAAGFTRWILQSGLWGVLTSKNTLKRAKNRHSDKDPSAL